jgi:hypothetical protein
MFTRNEIIERLVNQIPDLTDSMRTRMELRLKSKSDEMLLDAFKTSCGTVLVKVGSQFIIKSA